MQLTRRPVIANPQGEAIQCTRMDCFTLRVRNDVRDNLNCTHFTDPIFFNEKMELEDRHHFLSGLSDIESHYKERKFDSKKEAQTFIDSEIPEKLRAFFRRDNFSKLIVKNDSKIMDRD
jgi:hypothetical protein